MKTMNRIKKGMLLLGIMALAISVSARDMLEKGFTLKLAYIMPNADFGFFAISPTLSDSYSLSKANAGFGLQLGTMYFINAIDIGDQMKVGVDVTWMSFNYQTTTHDAFVQRVDGNNPFATFYYKEFNMTHLYFYPEVGPSFSYSPIEDMALDVSLKFSPVLSFSTGSYSIPVNGGQTETIIGRGFGFRVTPAFYFRYSVFLVGFEYNTGSLASKYQGSGGAFSTEQEYSTPMSSARIVFGFKF